MATINKTTIQAHEQSALAGVDKYYANVSSLTVGGVQYTPAAIKQVLTDDLTAQAAVGAQRATLRVGVKAAKQTRATANALLKALRVHIVDQYGSKAEPVLQDFGYPPPRDTKKTVKDKAQAVDKSLATRAARHTMGTKQKKSVKSTTTPETGGAAPAAGVGASK
jgi:hypothetical protein